MRSSDTRVPSSFVQLDVRSCFSLKEGAFTPEQLAVRATALGMTAVAMTDRDGLYGAARFVRACEREGVKPLLGASVTVRGARASPLDRDAHVVLLATDDTGYANLCRLLTDAHMLGERGDPWVDPVQICAHAAGLIAIAGPGSHPGRAAIDGRIDGAARLLDPFREAFGRDRLYRGHRAPARSRGRCRDPRHAAARRSHRCPRRGHQPGPLPGARRRVRGRRPGVHASHRAVGRHQRLAHQRRGLAETCRRRCAPCSPNVPICAMRPSRSPTAARSTWAWGASASRTSRRRVGAAPRPC